MDALRTELDIGGIWDTWSATVPGAREGVAQMTDVEVRNEAAVGVFPAPNRHAAEGRG